jgi:hypothetical protein
MRRILTAFLQSLGLPESVILQDVMAWNTISASERLSAFNASFKKIADQIFS